METKELTHWKKQFNYDYLGAHDLDEKENRTLTIKETVKKMVKGPDGKESECFVATFLEPSKPMILNKTNCKTIAKLYDSPYIEHWKGLRVIIYAQGGIKAFGNIVDALRVKNENPDIDLLSEIEKLFQEKKDKLSQGEIASMLRVTSNKEVRNYNKALKLLKSK